MLAALYVGAYLLLSEPTDNFPCVTTNDRSVYAVRSHEYRIEHPAVRTAFRPLEHADRRIRPEFWSLRKLTREERRDLMLNAPPSGAEKYLSDDRF